MKVVQKVGVRRWLLMAPFALIIILVIAISGPISSGGAYGLGTPLPPPVPGFTPAPLPCTGPGSEVRGTLGNPPACNGTTEISFNSIVPNTTVDALIANPANHGNAVAPNVHLIDVRSSFEYLSDVCPMQIALGLPLYTVTNVGHPVWTNPGGSHEEAYSDPYWIGFHWDGIPYFSLWNIRMQENPNFGAYLNALVADGSIKKNDNLVFVCQTGYRASWAGAEAARMGFTNVNVLYGGMLAWEDDWITDPTIIQPYQHLNSPSDPSPNDCPAGSGLTGNCDPDNIPGPNARPKSTVLVAPWKYNTARLALVGAPVVWNGTEPHVGVKPEWLPGDFQLSASKDSVFWASYADYVSKSLTVRFRITNNPPAPPGPLNYPAACGGAPAPTGTCEKVNQAPNGPAYNAQVVAAVSTNGVLASNLPAAAGTIPVAGSGTVDVKFTIPAAVGSFSTRAYATATDVPNPTAAYGAGMEWYGTYQYPGPKP